MNDIKRKLILTALTASSLGLLFQLAVLTSPAQPTALPPGDVPPILRGRGFLRPERTAWPQVGVDQSSYPTQVLIVDRVEVLLQTDKAPGGDPRFGVTRGNLVISGGWMTGGAYPSWSGLLPGFVVDSEYRRN
jgi:hypothetical protein